MVDPLSKTPLNKCVQKALMTPKVGDLVLHLVATNTMHGDLREPNNQPQDYHEFVNNSKLYHTIIAWYALDPLFSKPTQSEAFFLFKITSRGMGRQ